MSRTVRPYVAVRCTVNGYAVESRDRRVTEAVAPDNRRMLSQSASNLSSCSSSAT